MTSVVRKSLELLLMDGSDNDERGFIVAGRGADPASSLRCEITPWLSQA